jgi:hypothetical protein
VAWDSKASCAYPRFSVGIGGRHGRQVWDFPHGPSNRRQLRGPEETPRAEDRRQPSGIQAADQAAAGRCHAELAGKEAAQLIELPPFVSVTGHLPSLRNDRYVQLADYTGNWGSLPVQRLLSAALPGGIIEGSFNRRGAVP